jgi:C-terminal processing protease CtpA/Prc
VDILPGGLGYIDLSEFAGFDPKNPNDPARRAADGALRLVSGCDAVIVDLRENGGGSPLMVGYLVSAFVPAGADVYNTFHGRLKELDEKPRAALETPPRTAVPLYVLTSGATGSAAESFAYTLQTARRAKTVGERSVGGANPGGLFSVGDGFQIFISTAEPINPISHRNWEGVGVAPDIAAPSGDALKAAEIDALTTILKTAKPEEDLAARWALEALQRRTDQAPVGSLSDYVGPYGSRTVSLEDGHLTLRRRRSPASVLLSLGGDLFTFDEAPDVRVEFERDRSGAIVALVMKDVDEPDSRHARGAD